ncbi:type I polyketide synthase loading module domain protein [Mycobacterium ulcerans str. Harvey]|uniref:Type I polyketide synthase loading module domain protein n=1 Tax=Mycobacterium ulcerans str. Harvey TaxID=1299332 RepID=A0ABP3AV25_MYCUL|nr:type I polyketide synthase loading module domain protein [Mycobacterium ulcerans str. Harvey]
MQRIWRDHATPDVIYAKLNYPKTPTSTATASTPPYSTRFTPPTRPDPTPHQRHR